jgi:hypothetical protein
MDAKQLAIAELCLFCTNMDTESIENSSKKISKFATLFLNHALLIPISHEIWNLRNGYRAPLNSILKKLSKKTALLLKATKNYVETTHITQLNVINELPWLTLQPVADANVFYLQFFALQRIFKALLLDTTYDHRAFIEQYAKIDASNPLNPIIIFPIDTAPLEAELHYVHRTESMHEWYALDQLTAFLGIYDPKIYAEQRNSVRKQHPINDLVLTVRNNALNRAIGSTKDPQSPETGFNPREYKMYMEQLLLYVQKRFLTATLPSENTKITDWNYDSIKKTFSHNNKNARFRSNKNPGAVLEILTKNKKETRYYDDLYEQVIGCRPEEDAEMRMYEACEAINTMILRECGLKDFLHYNTTSVHINPQYLV